MTDPTVTIDHMELVHREGSRVVANADVRVGGLVVHGCKLIRSARPGQAWFMVPPSIRKADRFEDVVSIVDPALGRAILEALIAAYEAS